MLFFVLMLGGVWVDQLTKSVVFDRFGSEEAGREVISGVLRLTCRTNTGTVFGLFSGCNSIFVVLTAVTIIVVVACFLKSVAASDPMMTAAAGLIVAGAVGNLIDRIRFRHVRDFIDFYIWPVFNVADMLICIGAAGLIYASFKAARNKPVEEHEQSD